MQTLIKARELAREIKSKGAAEVAILLCEALKKDEVKYSDFPSLSELFGILVVDKKDGKSPLGKTIINDCDRYQSDALLIEEAGSYTDADAFTTVCSQLLFNALTTAYNSADLTLSNRVKKIPSTFINGEVFAGISNLGQIMKPTPFGKELPHVEPTEDKSRAPAQQRYGAIIDLTFNVMTSDRTGEFMHTAEKMFEAGAIAREMDCANTLADYAVRNRYNWKDSVYAAYQATTPWVNLKGSNALSTDPNACLQPAQKLIDQILDPFTGLPLATPEGPYSLIVTPENFNIARMLAAQEQYRSGASATTYQTLTAKGNQHDIEVIKSKYLWAAIQAQSDPTSTWFYGHMNCISRQESLDVTTSQAMPGSYTLWARGIAASFKWENVYTHYWFQPRFMVKNTVA